MEIRGIGGVDPLDKNQAIKTNKTHSTIKPILNPDSLKVSDHARFLEDEAFIREVLAKIPDIDQEKINRIKNKLHNGDYNNKESLDILTEKLSKALGL